LFLLAHTIALTECQNKGARSRGAEPLNSLGVPGGLCLFCCWRVRRRLTRHVGCFVIGLPPHALGIMRACVRACVRTCIRACVRGCVHASVRACVMVHAQVVLVSASQSPLMDVSEALLSLIYPLQ
jgi:hypothetical protein